MTSGKRISELRIAHHVELKDLAKRIHLNPTELEQIEAGHRTMSRKNIELCAQIFAVDPDYITGKTDDPTPNKKKAPVEPLEETTSAIAPGPAADCVPQRTGPRSLIGAPLKRSQYLYVILAFIGIAALATLAIPAFKINSIDTSFYAILKVFGNNIPTANTLLFPMMLITFLGGIVDIVIGVGFYLLDNYGGPRPYFKIGATIQIVLAVCAVIQFILVSTKLNEGVGLMAGAFIPQILEMFGLIYVVLYHKLDTIEKD